MEKVKKLQKIQKLKPATILENLLLRKKKLFFDLSFSHIPKKFMSAQ